jgi:hypothetical protein
MQARAASCGARAQVVIRRAGQRLAGVQQRAVHPDRSARSRRRLATQPDRVVDAPAPSQRKATRGKAPMGDPSDGQFTVAFEQPANGFRSLPPRVIMRPRSPSTGPSWVAPCRHDRFDWDCPITAMISSVCGGSPGYRIPWLRGGQPRLEQRRPRRALMPPAALDGGEWQRVRAMAASALAALPDRSSNGSRH